MSVTIPVRSVSHPDQLEFYSPVSALSESFGGGWSRSHGPAAIVESPKAPRQISSGAIAAPHDDKSPSLIGAEVRAQINAVPRANEGAQA